MAFEQRVIVFGREPWYQDAGGFTVRPHDEDYDPETLTHVGVILGIAVWEGSDHDRPGQKQIGPSREEFVPFSVDPDGKPIPELHADVLNARTQTMADAIRDAAKTVRFTGARTRADAPPGGR